MAQGEVECIRGDVSERLAAELLAHAAQIQVDVTHGEVTLADRSWQWSSSVVPGDHQLRP